MTKSRHRYVIVTFLADRCRRRRERRVCVVADVRKRGDSQPVKETGLATTRISRGTHFRSTTATAAVRRCVRSTSTQTASRKQSCLSSIVIHGLANDELRRGELPRGHRQQLQRLRLAVLHEQLDATKETS